MKAIIIEDHNCLINGSEFKNLFYSAAQSNNKKFKYHISLFGEIFRTSNSIADIMYT